MALQPLAKITPASASVDGILIFEQRERDDENVRDTAPLIIQEVTVVNAASLSAAMTVDDDLSTSTRDGTPLEVVLSGATLTAAATPGTITIVGEDASGDALTLVLTFATAALATPQYPDALFTEITSVTPAGFSAGTCTIVALGASSGGDAFPLQPLVNEGDLALTGELIEAAYKSGNAASKKGISGPLDIANGLTVSATGDAGCLLPLSLMLQPRRFDWHVRNGTGKTYPADIDVVAELDIATRTRAAAQTVRRALADNLSTSDNPRKITLTPIPPIIVVNAQSIAAGTALTLANDLDGDRDTAVRLSVTLASAALSTQSTPGTITIVGTDTDDNVQTEIVSFANDALDVAQTPTDTWKTITSVTPAGFNAGTVTMSELPIAIASGKTQATILIIGTDNNDDRIAEQVPVSASQVSTAQTTDQFFKTVTEIRCADFASGLFKVTARDRSVVVTMTPQDKQTYRYWKIEYSKGGVPNVYDGLRPQSMNFSIGSRTEMVNYTIAFLGRKGDTYTNLAGETHDDTSIPPFYPEPTPTHSDLKFSEPDFFPGWQAKILIDGVLMYATSASFSYETGYVNGDAISGDRFQTAAPTRDAMRALMLDLTIQYSRENDFSGLFRKNATLRNVEVQLINQPEGGFPELQIWRFPTAQVQNSSDPATSGQSRITQQVQLKAFDNDFGVPNDIVVVVHLPELVLPRVF